VTIDAATIDELEQIQRECQQAIQEEREASEALHEIQQRKLDVQRLFEDKLKHATDPANAIVIGKRAYWMSNGTFCYINLKTPVDM
jgi:hypothetical protein